MLRSFLVIIFLILISCGEKVIEEPENLISKQKMAEILYDLALINAARSTNPKILEEHSVEPTSFLFEKHNIDSLQFVQSDVYYASIPVEYESIYENVASKLEEHKAAIEEARKRKNDSIRKLSGKDSLKNKNLVRKTARDTLP